MSEQERNYWEGHATSEEAAKAAIAADESAWSGEVLEKCLALILPCIDAAPCRKDKPRRVLDLGCGTGRLTLPIAFRRPVEITGVDVSQRMLDLAAERQRQHPLHLPNIAWRLCDGRSLPPELGRIDVAYSMITMQHIPRDGQATYIREVGAALIRGGIFRFQVLEGTGASFMHHEVDAGFLTAACEEAGLHVTELQRVPAFNGTTEVTPLWVMAVKK